MRFRPRFTLRTLLIATAALGILFGWVTSVLVRANHQRQVVARLEGLGASTYFDWQLDLSVPYQNRSPHGWKPLLWIFGDDAFSSIARVAASDTSKLTDEEVTLLTELPALTGVALVGPEITDRSVVTLRKLPNLRTLALQDTSISADGLAKFADHPKLVAILLLGAGTNDALLAGLKSLKHLEDLHLFKTAVTSAGLQHLEQLPGLKMLDIFEARAIDDEGMHSIGKLAALNYLSLIGTSIGDNGLAEVARLSNLEDLTIWNGKGVLSSITDVGVQHLGKLRKLRELLLHDFKFGDVGMEALSNLTGLQSLVVEGSQITDASAPWLAKLKNLRDLDLSQTDFSDAGMNQLTPLTQLKSLNVGPNVSESAARELRKSLPNCSINCVDATGNKVFSLP